MPRIISARRKYLEALSKADSLPWSQRLGEGRRKPGWGGPAGVAARDTEEEKFAVEPMGMKGERREATSLATCREEAIATIEKERRREERSGERSELTRGVSSRGREVEVEVAGLG